MTRGGWDSSVFLAATMAWLPLLLDAALKGLIVLAAAGVLCLLLRRASAALRHLVWCVAIGQAVAMPLLSLALPGWRLPVLPEGLATLQTASAQAEAIRLPPGPNAAPPAVRPRPAAPAARPAPSAAALPDHPVTANTRPMPSTPRTAPVEGGAAAPHGWTWVLLVWLLGAALAAAPVLIGTLSLWRMTQRVRPLTESSWAVLLESLTARLNLQRPVRLRESDQVNVPMTWGLLRPVVLLPSDAQNWSEERRRLVLLHELAHIQRADCLTQLLAQIACALYWFNPLTWLAARQLRMERERACDDQVLHAGARASAYAQHLLEIARGARGASCASLAAVAMARPSQLEGRLLAVLDGERSRRSVSRLAVLVAVVAGCAMVLPLAALEAAARGGQSGKRAALVAEGQATGMVTRRVWGPVGSHPKAAPSPDGRYLSFVDSETGDLTLHNLATGKTRRLTNKGSLSSSSESASWSTFSPDGQQVAYAWRNKEGFVDLRLIGIQGSGRRILCANKEVQEIRPADWSQDGKQILAIFDRKDGTDQIVLVSVADGSVRVLKTDPRAILERVTLSPDGRTIAYDYQPKTDAPERDIFLLATDGSGETPLGSHSADDMDPLWTPDGKSLLFLSDRTGSLGEWVVAVADGKPQGAPELVKREMGTAFNIGFARNGSLYYGVQAGIMDVYTAPLDPATGKVVAPPQPVNPRLEGSNSYPAWSPDGRYLAYLSPMRNALAWESPGTLSIRAVESGETRVHLLKQSLAQPSWSADGRSLLAAGDRTGALRIDVQTGAITAIPNAVRSMEEGVWALDGKSLFYSAAVEAAQGSGPGPVVIRARDLRTGREKELNRVAGSLWNLALSYDGGRLALVSQERGTGYSSLQVIPAAGGEPRELLRVKAPEWINTVAWMPDGRHLLFGRRDEAWWIAVAGGEPQPLGLAMKHLRDLRVHPDGRRIAFTAGLGEMEIWVMENFLPGAQTARALTPGRAP
jgi:Tol biopolymer transport system component/beta-lactamase regulating signal transducer with metallopeptidase domain